ncbi:MAG: DUF975 family protein [Clostridia bacterium]|nr:DUF975 family protein [Clostridia bacterium]
MYLARDFRSIARKSLKGFWGLSVGVTLVASLLGGNRASDSETIYFSNTLNALFASPTFYAILTAAMTVFTILSVLYLLIGGAVELGLNRYSLDLVTRRNQPAFGTLFSRFSMWGKAFGLRFMTSLFTFLWALLFVIPGIVAAYRYALAPYLMAENPDIGVMEAIARSKELMRGNKGRLFCLQFSFIGWYLLSTLTLGIGTLWLAPYRKIAETAFYLDVTGRAKAMPRPDRSAEA